MNLLFDLIATQPNIDGKFHGGGKYAKKVYLDLIKSNNNRATIIAVMDSGKYLDEDIELVSIQFNILLVDIKQTALNSIIKAHSIDRFYSALPDHIPNITSLGCEVVGTIHGLRELETRLDLHAVLYTNKIKLKVKIALRWLLRSYLYKKKYNYYKYLFKKINILFTDSEHSKYSLMAHFPFLNENDIKVYYAADVTDFNEIAETDNFDQSEYFLMVSGNRWLKNNLRSAIALDQLFTERPHIKNNVIITGVSDTKIYLDHINNKNRFTFYKYVDESLLSLLYKNAFAFLYVSLNEGFGYPPLEAMKYKVPVISSPFTSLTEICGTAALYADPYSIQEIKSRILELFESKTYEKLTLKGIEQYNFIKGRQEKDLTNMLNDLLDVEIDSSLEKINNTR